MLPLVLPSVTKCYLVHYQLLTIMAESNLQAQCFMHHWNTYPEYRRLLHANNNNSLNRIKGSQNKAVGVVAGVSDLEYFFAGQMHFIELKTDEGRQSKEQQDFEAKVIQQGGYYHVVRSFEDFRILIERIHQKIFAEV